MNEIHLLVMMLLSQTEDRSCQCSESVIFDIEKVKSISKEEISPVFKIDNKIKTP